MPHTTGPEESLLVLTASGKQFSRMIQHSITTQRLTLQLAVMIGLRSKSLIETQNGQRLGKKEPVFSSEVTVRNGICFTWEAEKTPLGPPASQENKKEVSQCSRAGKHLYYLIQTPLLTPQTHHNLLEGLLFFTPPLFSSPAALRPQAQTCPWTPRARLTDSTVPDPSLPAPAAATQHRFKQQSIRILTKHQKPAGEGTSPNP